MAMFARAWVAAAAWGAAAWGASVASGVMLPSRLTPKDLRTSGFDSISFMNQVKRANLPEGLDLDVPLGLSAREYFHARVETEKMLKRLKGGECQYPHDGDKVVYLMRHARKDDKMNETLPEFKDPRLTDPRGKMEARALQAFDGLPWGPLSEDPLQRVQLLVVSPTRRTMESAILGFQGLLPWSNWRLENNVTEWGAQSNSTLGENMLREYNVTDLLDMYTALPPGWTNSTAYEYEDEMQDRWANFTSSLLRGPQRRIFVISHAMILREACDGCILKQGQVQPASVTSNGTWRLLSNPDCWPSNGAWRGNDPLVILYNGTIPRRATSVTSATNVSNATNAASATNATNATTASNGSTASNATNVITAMMVAKLHVREEEVKKERKETKNEKKKANKDQKDAMKEANKVAKKEQKKNGKFLESTAEERPQKKESNKEKQDANKDVKRKLINGMSLESADAQTKEPKKEKKDATKAAIKESKKEPNQTTASPANVSLQTAASSGANVINATK